MDPENPNDVQDFLDAFLKDMEPWPVTFRGTPISVPNTFFEAWSSAVLREGDDLEGASGDLETVGLPHPGDRRDEA